jgi:hypothetical protein
MDLRWHDPNDAEPFKIEDVLAELYGLRAMRDRAAAIARNGSSEAARATAAVILSAVTE